MFLGLMQKCRASHTTVLPCGYAQQSPRRQRLVSGNFFGSVTVVDESALALLLGVVDLEISQFCLYCFPNPFPSPNFCQCAWPDRSSCHVLLYSNVHMMFRSYFRTVSHGPRRNLGHWHKLNCNTSSALQPYPRSILAVASISVAITFSSTVSFGYESMVEPGRSRHLSR